MSTAFEQASRQLERSTDLDRLEARADYEVVDESEEFILFRKLPEDERDAARERRAQDRKDDRKGKKSSRRPAAKGKVVEDGDDELDEEDDEDNPYHDGDAKPVIRFSEQTDRGRNDEEE